MIVSNRLSPYGAIPRVLGQRRLFPVLAAKPYTETIGNERYMRLLLLVGYGPLNLDDLRIGSTPIGAFDGAEVELREGWENDQPITLYTQRIEEDPLSIALTSAGGWRTITSRPGARELSLDISFDRGLAFYNDQGGRSTATVACRIPQGRRADLGADPLEGRRRYRVRDRRNHHHRRRVVFPGASRWPLRCSRDRAI